MLRIIGSSIRNIDQTMKKRASAELPLYNQAEVEGENTVLMPAAYTHSANDRGIASLLLSRPREPSPLPLVRLLIIERLIAHPPLFAQQVSLKATSQDERRMRHLWNSKGSSQLQAQLKNTVLNVASSVLIKIDMLRK